MEGELDAANAEIARLRAECEWRPIETAPKGRKLIVGYRNCMGNWRTVMACYYPPDTLDSEDTKSEFADEGWYEESETHEKIMRTDEEPSHWMPLPDEPKEVER